MHHHFWVLNVQVYQIRPASYDDFTSFHAEDYIQFLKNVNVRDEVGCTPHLVVHGENICLHEVWKGASHVRKFCHHVLRLSDGNPPLALLLEFLWILR